MTDRNHEPGAIAQHEKRILGQPPRIAPLTEWTEEMRALVAPPPGYENTPPVMYGILLHNVPFFRAYKDIMTYFLVHGALPVRDRELATLRVGWLCRVPFIWGEHVKHGKRIGLTAEEIERVTQGSQAPRWNEHDRAILRAVEELLEESMISDATWTTLSKTLDAKLLVELTALVGQYQALGYLQNALRIPLFAGNPGLAAR
jgi:alkylhydroperoxidase family enzyme